MDGSATGGMEAAHQPFVSTRTRPEAPSRLQDEGASCSNVVVELSSSITCRSSSNTEPMTSRDSARGLLSRLWELWRVILGLGCYAFGGPAGLAVFLETFVKRGWVTDKEFTHLLALGDVLPGPNTTIIITAVGVYRAGLLGGIVAFVAWTTPSLIVLVAAGVGMARMSTTPVWLNGLPAAAVALIFVAVLRLAKTIVKTHVGAVVVLVSASISVAVQEDSSLPPDTLMWLLPVLMVAGGAIELCRDRVSKRRQRTLYAAADADNGDHDENISSQPSDGVDRPIAQSSVDVEESAPNTPAEETSTYDRVPVPWWLSLLLLACIATFLAWYGVSHARYHTRASQHQRGYHHRPTHHKYMQMFGHLFVVGITIYGGGQVILPVLIGVCVKSGWLTMEQFLQGFALVQMLPGPLYNMSGYIGAVYLGIPGAIVGWLGLCLPGVLLVPALLPLWDRLRKVPSIEVFLGGVNCVGLGLILSVAVSLYSKIVTTPANAIVAMTAGALIVALRYSTLVGVVCAGLLGVVLSPVCLNVAQGSMGPGSS